MKRRRRRGGGVTSPFQWCRWVGRACRGAVAREFGNNLRFVRTGSIVVWNPGLRSSLNGPQDVEVGSCTPLPKRLPHSPSSGAGLQATLSSRCCGFRPGLAATCGHWAQLRGKGRWLGWWYELGGNRRDRRRHGINGGGSNTRSSRGLKPTAPPCSSDWRHGNRTSISKHVNQ